MKQIIAVSKERDCWSLEELKEIDITYHNVSEIISQLQGKDPVLPEPVLHGSMDEVD